MAKPIIFKTNSLFFKPVQMNIQHDSKKKIINIHKPLVDGPSNIDLPIKAPIALVKDKENCCMINQNMGTVPTTIKNITYTKDTIDSKCISFRFILTPLSVRFKPDKRRGIDTSQRI
jgi:hypothetical protein